MAKDNKHRFELRAPICGPMPKVSRGIWYGDHPIDHPYTVFLMQMIIMSITCQLIYRLLRPLKQPKFVCHLLGGMLVGPFVLGRKKSVLTDEHFPAYQVICAKVWANFGFIYFIFLAAVKVDVAIIGKTIKSASIIGIASVFSSIAAILALDYTINVPGLEKANWFYVMFAVGLSLTRFPNVAYTFDEMNLLSSELGQLAMSTSMVSEVLSCTWMLTTLYEKHRNHLQGAVASVVGYLLFMVLIIRPILRWIVRTTPEGNRSADTYSVLVLIGALVGALIADFIGLLQIGVLVMGLIVPNGPPLGSALVKNAEFFVVELIMPMFYVMTGFYTEFYFINLQTFGVALLVVFISLATKLAGAFLSGVAQGADVRHALLLGLMLNIKGPFDFWTFTPWMFSHGISKGLYASLVVCEMLLTAIITPIIDRLYGASVRMNAVEVKKNMRAVQSTPRDRELRILCCIHGEEDVPGMITLLKATNPTTSTPMCAYVIHLNEAVGHANPTIVSHGNQLGKVMSKRSCHIMQAFDNYVKNSSDDRSLIVKAFSVTAPHKSMHEYVCKLALDQQIPLIIVPFPGTSHEFDVAHAAAMRNVNSNVQAHSPCTVGILVDRTAWYSMSSSATFEHTVAVVFIGGADDREALSLGTRMSCHPKVSVSVLRIVPPNQSTSAHDLIDNKLDQKLIEEFKVKNVNNSRAVYQESVVADAEDAMNRLQSMKNQYNLIIVGGQGKLTKSMFNEVMLDWSENPELGVIGDFLASADFCDGRTSVLVMQHYGDTRGSRRKNSSEYEEQSYLLRSTIW